MMHYRFHAQSDPGRVRGNNEDAYAFDAQTGVAVLADGMGGYNAGEVASGMATSFIMTELVRWLASAADDVDTEQIGQEIRMCCAESNAEILNASLAHPPYFGMGTTVVAGVFRDDQLVLGHVGDSRCYRLRAGVLTQITKDHSMLQEQVDAGVMTPEEAAIAPGKNLLTRAMGVEASIKVEVHVHPVQAHDVYLMCSDGLTDMLDDHAIADLLGRGGALEVRARDLIDQANAHGGRDNVTVVLVEADAQSG